MQVPGKLVSILLLSIFILSFSATSLAQADSRAQIGPSYDVVLQMRRRQSGEPGAAFEFKRDNQTASRELPICGVSPGEYFYRANREWRQFRIQIDLEHLRPWARSRNAQFFRMVTFWPSLGPEYAGKE